MGAVDVVLLLVGAGQSSATLLDHATAGGPLPMFHGAELGPMTTDYPDLVVAAVLGGIVAGRSIQQRTAMLVGILATAYGGFFAVAHMLPATVPSALVIALVEWGPAARARPLRRPRCSACRRRESSRRLTHPFPDPVPA
jgi:hypothetical protein